MRVIAATNINLQEAVRNGKFREDLYYRLSTVPIYIPPLRERGEDIYQLFRKFCIDFAERNKIQPVKLTDDAKELILKYPWPGNVRQLKNVAEQVSILAMEKDVSAKELKQIVTDITDNRLPALAEAKFQSGGSGFTEREILYKLIFDLKKDLNDLKQFVYDITKHQVNGEQIPVFREQITNNTTSEKPFMITQPENNHPVVLQDKKEFDESETVEESLSIADKERELIIRALKKHRNKRKDAATDLGISERTLYRKIKEYGVEI